MATPDYSKTRDLLLKRTIRSMKLQLLMEVAGEYNLKVPWEMDSYETAQYLIDNLSGMAKNEIIERYGDAGKPLSHFFALKEPAPDLEVLKKNAAAMFYPQQQAKKGLEDFPYFNEIETHKSTNSLRIRFQYIKGIQPYFDDESGTIKELRRLFPGCIIIRPHNSLLEIRTTHASMARKVAVKTARMELPPCLTLDLTESRYMDKFLDWIYSLNNGKIDLPPTDSRSSVSMSARRGRNLLQTRGFLDELNHGQLRGGHVTIEEKKDSFTKFSIIFKPCHIHFTSYSSNTEIESIVSALQKIVEGYEFVSTETLLKFIN